MLTKNFPADFKELDYIREFVGNAASAAGMDDREVYAVQLATDEACSNIIEHGYGGVNDREIHCTCEVSPGQLIITLRDRGLPFDPSHVPQPDLSAPLDERKIGGLGLFLMRTLMNEVTYSTTPEGENILVLVKRSESRAAGAAEDAPPKPDWRELFELGERILTAPDFEAQRDQIVEMARRLVKGEVLLWLDESQFRLPDWNDSHFPSAPPAPFMGRAFSEVRIVRGRDGGPVVALPFEHEGMAMGALQVRREQGVTFTRREVDLLAALVSHAAVALVASHRISVERWRLSQLNLVRTVSAQIANVQSLDELCRKVARLIQSTFSYYYVAIFTLGPGESSLRYRSSAASASRRKGQAAPVLQVDVGQGIIGHVAQSGEEILCNDVSKEPRYRPIDGLPETLSEVSIPIRIESRVLGVLDVQSDQLDAFHPYDLLVLRALADNIALAVEGTHLYSRLERRAEQLAAIAEVSRSINTILDLRLLLESAAALIRRRFGFPHVHLFTVHHNRRQIVYEAGSGSKSVELQGYALDLDDTDGGLIPWAARKGKTVLANDVAQEPRYRPSPFPPANTRSELVIPLVFDKKVVGVLDIQSDKLNAFKLEDKQVFEALSDSIAAAIHNASLYNTEQWRRQVSESLREVAGLLSANASLEEVLDSILTELERNLPADIATIWLLDEEDIQLAAVHGAAADPVIAARYDSPEASAWLTQALLAREPFIRRIEDPYSPSACAANYNPDHSTIAAALRIGDQAVGVLTLSHHTPGRYGSEALAMVTTFASYAAVAIENARLYDSAQEQAYASAALLQVAQAAASLSDLDEILGTIVRILPILVGVERALVYSWDEDAGRFVPLQEYALPDEARDALWVPLAPESFPLLQAAFEAGTPVVSTESYLDPQDWPRIPPPREEDHQSIMAADDRLLMAFPLMVKNEVTGVLLVEEAMGGRRFRSRRIEILNGVAQQAALAIQNDRFEGEMRARERLETEVQLARQIQRTFIPETLPSHSAWDLSARWRTARQVGGDFFDVFDLPKNRLGVFIADVADKGVPAALFMALTRTLMRAAVGESVTPADALRRVNRLLYPDCQQGMFVTAVYGVLDTDSGVFTYANAGHNPPLWLHEGRIERLTRTGMALGVLEDTEMNQAAITLQGGDTLLLYTDGVTEAFAPEYEPFGEARLLELVRSTARDSAGALLDAIEGAVFEFMETTIPADDLTLIAVKRNP
jgi:serine phosphatase RsbU (regulator of sigma subunit)/putative methionine-R-sulfoxide reductase with GAF domain/anti-sigma regulatory factor (Ser/Thr protein kinase)